MLHDINRLCIDDKISFSTLKHFNIRCLPTFEKPFKSSYFSYLSKTVELQFGTENLLKFVITQFYLICLLICVSYTV